VDYYALLGIPVTATTEDILAAHRRAALQHHADTLPTDKAAEAYATFIPYRDAEYLTQPNDRAGYDRVHAEYRNWEPTVKDLRKGIPPRWRQGAANAIQQTDRLEPRSYRYDSKMKQQGERPGVSE
jgi:curved DNA-binding protein CbpA